MSLRKSNGFAPVLVALLMGMSTIPQPVFAQPTSGKQQPPGAIPSTRQALSGRLFFSREQRERLDRARIAGETAGEAGAIDPPVSGINGFVKRSDGEISVWVDGKARYSVSGGNAERLRPEDIGGTSNELHILASGGRARSNVRESGLKTMAKIPREQMPASANRDGLVVR